MNNLKSFFATCLLLVITANANAVTVDFDSNITNEDIQGFSSLGFDFQGNANFWEFGTGEAGTTGVFTSDPGCGGCVPVGWQITATDGSLFEVDSIWSSAFGSVGTTASAAGLTADGTWLTMDIPLTANVTSFGSEWTDLTLFQISVDNGGPFATISIDNFTASIVPIPAAFWLFGSALGLLGWVQRKRT